MGLSKISQYNEEEMRLYAMSKALAHPARIRIINYLKIYHQIDLNEIPRLVELAPSTIKAHLRWLEDVELISVERNGNKGTVFLLSTTNLASYIDNIIIVNSSASQQLTKVDRHYKLQRLTKTKGVPFLVSMLFLIINLLPLLGAFMKSNRSESMIIIAAANSTRIRETYHWPNAFNTSYFAKKLLTRYTFEVDLSDKSSPFYDSIFVKNSMPMNSFANIITLKSIFESS
jgi:predicted transcriptional regulator